MERNVKDYDPLMALDGGEDGLNFYRIIADISPAPAVFVEIGIGQENLVQQIFKEKKWQLLDTKKDFGDITRVLILKKDL